MSAAREKDSADFDLERFVDMFDEAMTSRDPRVMDALRGLMMIVTLTRPESRDSGLHDRNAGPLRRLYEDMNHMHRRIERVEELYRQAERSRSKDDYYKYPYEKYTLAAAQEMASKIDQDTLDKIKAKGLLDK
jgi:hypothetical protein